VIDQLTVEAAVTDARLAVMEFDDAQAWLRAHQTLMEPLAAEVWVTDRTYSYVLLVRHRVRGWVRLAARSSRARHRGRLRPVNSWSRLA
jgi:8-oxo-dGTP diphosphatase